MSTKNGMSPTLSTFLRRSDNCAQALKVLCDKNVNPDNWAKLDKKLEEIHMHPYAYLGYVAYYSPSKHRLSHLQRVSYLLSNDVLKDAVDFHDRRRQKLKTMAFRVPDYVDRDIDNGFNIYDILTTNRASCGPVFGLEMALKHMGGACAGPIIERFKSKAYALLLCTPLYLEYCPRLKSAIEE